MMRQEALAYIHVGPDGSLVRKIIIALISKLFGIKIFTHYHSATFQDYLAYPGLKRKGLILLTRLSSNNLVLSEWWRSLFEYNEIERVAIVPNCINTPSEVNFDSCVKGRIFSIGRLEKSKCIDLAIKALYKINSEFTLSIAGDGAEKKHLIDLSLELNLSDRVNFLGWVHGDNKYNLYKESQVLVVPSKSDSFGMVFIESLSLGCPVVIGPNPAVIAALTGLPGVYIAKGYDSESVANAIIEAVSSNVDRQFISASCLQRYSTLAVSEKLISSLGLK